MTDSANQEAEVSEAAVAQASENKESESVTTPPKRSLKERWLEFPHKVIALSAAGALIALGSGAGAWAIWSADRQVVIEVSIDDVYSGALDDDCNLTVEGEEYDLGSLRIKEVGGSERVTVEPMIEDRGTGCAAVATVIASPMNSWAVTFAGEDLGEMSPEVIRDGFFETSVEIEVTHDISGSFYLGDVYDACSGTLADWTCTNEFYFIDSFGIETNSETGECSGKGGYSDLREGTTVRLEGQSNGQTLTTGLLTGEFTLISVEDRNLWCVFDFAFDQVPHDPAGYTIEVSRRGVLGYSIEDLREAEWTLSPSLGDLF